MLLQISLTWVQPSHAQPADREETVEDKEEDRSHNARGSAAV